MSALNKLRDLITGSNSTNENPIIRMVRSALIAAGAAGATAAINQGITLPHTYAWMAPMIYGALQMADKWLIRHEQTAPTSATTPPTA